MGGPKTSGIYYKTKGKEEKMKLEIKLRDLKYCDFKCPYVEARVENTVFKYWECKRFFRSLKIKGGTTSIIRPPICIEQNGK